MVLEQIEKIYFVGIGGIGMSALARYFKSLGCEVFGYDKTESDLTKKLVEEGMIIHYNENVDNIPHGIDLVVYTPAIPDSHKELVYFRNEGFPIKKRAEVLGIISQSKKVLAIAGTHGKTTTTSLLTHILKIANIDCTAFLGGIALDFESNYVAGTTDYVVVEADEFDRSFLHLKPYMAAIMSMDADHLDIYGEQAQMHDAFRQFASAVDHKVFYKNGLPLGLENTKTFGIEKGDAKAQGLHIKNARFVFDFKNDKTSIENIAISLPGHHNIENALAAISIALEIGAEPSAIKRALEGFKGIKRRFEWICNNENGAYVDDYAHHPTELEAAIKTMKALFPNQKITGVFQPHLFSRTADFYQGFAKALDLLDEAILLDIYPAREEPIQGVDTGLIFNQMHLKNKKWLSKAATIDYLKTNKPNVLITLGAGDIDRIVKTIKTIYS